MSSMVTVWAAFCLGCLAHTAATPRPETLVPPAGVAGLLGPLDGEEAAQQSGNIRASTPETRQGLALLSEYEAAYQARDIDRLARVWEMDAYERLVMSKLFRNYESLSVSVVPVTIRPSRAGLLVDFDQISARLEGSVVEAHLRASLLRRSNGEWMIFSVARLQEPALIGFGASRDDGALATMREFQAAFEEKDIDRLAAVWLMSSLERDTTERVFKHGRDTRVRLELRGIESKGSRATVDFDQRLITATTRPVQSALDRLSAWIARAADGRWVISQMRPRQP